MIGFTTCVECPIIQIIIQDFYRRQEKLSSGMKCRIDDELDISVDTVVLAHHWRRMVMTDGIASHRSVSQPYLVGWWDGTACSSQWTMRRVHQRDGCWPFHRSRYLTAFYVIARWRRPAPVAVSIAVKFGLSQRAFWHHTSLNSNRTNV